MNFQIFLFVSLSLTMVKAAVNQSQWMATLSALQQRMCPSPDCEYSESTLITVSQKLKMILPQAIRSPTIQQISARKMDQVIDACLPNIPRSPDNTFRLCDNSNQQALFQCAQQNMAALMGKISPNLVRGATRNFDIDGVNAIIDDIVRSAPSTNCQIA